MELVFETGVRKHNHVIDLCGVYVIYGGRGWSVPRTGDTYTGVWNRSVGTWRTRDIRGGDPGRAWIRSNRVKAFLRTG